MTSFLNHFFRQRNKCRSQKTSVTGYTIPQFFNFIRNIGVHDNKKLGVNNFKHTTSRDALHSYRVPFYN